MSVTGSPSSAAILTVDINTASAEAKLTTLEQRLGKLGVSATSNQEPAQIQSLKTQLAELESQLKTLSSTASKPLAKLVREGDAEEVARYTRSLKTYAETLNSIGQRQVVFSDTVKNTATGVRQLTREFEVSQKVINETTRNYMSHFEMVSRGARASAAQVKASMEAMTAVRPGTRGESLEDMNRKYREMERALNAVNAANARWNATSAERTQAAVASLTAQNTELSKLGDHYRQLEIQDSRAIAERMTKQQQVEAQSYDRRRELALKHIGDRQAAESRYTAWWASELRKREVAEASSAMRSAEQRSRLQVVNSERLARMLTVSGPGTSEIAKDYMSSGAVMGGGGELARLEARYRQIDMQEIRAIAERMNKQQQVEAQSYERRRELSMKSIAERQAAEAKYTAWWAAELKKREMAEAAAASRLAEQRSRMQAFNTQRLERTLYAPAAGTSALAQDYIAQGAVQGGGTALAQAELRANQALMASQAAIASSNAAAAAAKDKTALAAGRMGEQLRRVGHQSWKATEGQLALHSALRGVGGAMGALWLTYGRYVTVMAGAMAVTKAFKDSVVGGMDADFQAQFVSILQTKGDLDVALKNSIRTSLIDIARESVFTVQENADALRKLSLAGIDATNGLKLLTTASNAAIFAQQDMATTTGQVLDTLNNFGLASNNSIIMERNFNKVADVMAYTAITVNASFTDIAESFKNLTGVAGSFNVTIEESAALLQSLARTGIRGPKAGTYLRNALDDLLGAPISRRAEQTFDELQIPRFDPTMYGEGEFGVARYFDDLIAKVKEYGFVEQQDIIRSITNQRSRRVLRQELIESYKQENSLLERTSKLAQDAEGSLTKLAEGLTNNAQMQMRYAQAAYNSAVTQAFAGNEDMFIELGRSLQSVFNSDNFRDFISAGVVGIANLGNALVGLIRIVTDLREPLEWVGRAILMVGTSLAAIKITTWALSLGTATTGVVALGKALTALALAHPILTGIAVGANAAFLALSKFKEMNSPEYKIAALKNELAELETQLNAPRSRISPYVDMTRDDAGTRQRIEQIKEELATFMSSAEGIDAARAEYKNQIERFEAEFTQDVERISQVVKNRLGPDATIGERLALEAKATQAALNDIQRLYDEYARIVSDLDGVRRAGFLSEQGRLELESSIAVLDTLAVMLGNLEDKVANADNRFATNTISEALKAMGDNSDLVTQRLGAMGLQLDHVSDLLNLANEDWEGQNKALRQSVRDLELGKDGLHSYNQAMKELAVESAQAALSLALLDSVNISLGEDSMAIAEQKVRQLVNYIVQLQENISLSERKFTLEQKPPRGSRSQATNEVRDVRKAADAEYNQWMESVNYSKRIVELRKKNAMINEYEYQAALDGLAGKSIELGVQREQKIQDEIRRQLGTARDASTKNRLNSLMEESVAKEAQLKLTAELEVDFINQRQLAEAFKLTQDYKGVLEDIAKQHQRTRDELFENRAVEVENDFIRRAGAQAVLDVTRAYRDELEKVDRLIRDTASTPSIQAVHVQHREELVVQRGVDQDKARADAQYWAETRRSFNEGWDTAFRKFNDDATDYAAKAQSAFDTMSKGMHDGFENFFMNPTKEGFKGLLQSFLQMLQKMIAEAAAAQLTQKLLGSPGSPSGIAGMGMKFASMLIGGGGGTQAPAPVIERSFFATGGAFDTDSLKKFAKGGTFDTSNVVPFARGGAFGKGEILTSPTFFKFANGGQFRDGVAGEAGPEAALPLKRMANGKLGVEVDGAGGQTININVNVAPGTPAEVKRAAGAGAREALGAMTRMQRYG